MITPWFSISDLIWEQVVVVLVVVFVFKKWPSILSSWSAASSLPSSSLWWPCLVVSSSTVPIVSMLWIKRYLSLVNSWIHNICEINGLEIGKHEDEWKHESIQSDDNKSTSEFSGIPVNEPNLYCW